MQAEGSSISCYVSDLLNEVSGSDEDAVRDTAAGIYTGKRFVVTL